MEAEAQRLKKNLCEEIRNESERKIRKKTDEIKSKYDLKLKGIYGLLITSVLYGFFVTILQMFLSKRIKRDFLVIFSKMDGVITPLEGWAEDVLAELWKIRNAVGNETAGAVLAAIICILVAVFNVRNLYSTTVGSLILCWYYVS